MQEITQIALDNEMDLILAHRQSMKIVELTGASLSSQTSFATAVSEISRIAIEHGSNASLFLSVSDKRERNKCITAHIKDDNAEFITIKSEGYKYARKLVNQISIETTGRGVVVELLFNVAATFRFDDIVVENWRILFNTDPAVSPYEEIKRKNKQLVELSDKLKESEAQYKELTNSLPLMIFTLDKNNKVTYANEWLQEYTGQTIETLNSNDWSEVLHSDESKSLWEGLGNQSSEYLPISIERRLKNYVSGEYRWYTGIITPMLDETGELSYWTAYLADIHAQKTIEQTLKANTDLKSIQATLHEKIVELNRSNEELERFAYIASHDLQEPLRKIRFYSDFLQKKYGDKITGDGAVFVNNIIGASDRMKELIHDILSYSTISKPNQFELQDLNEIANDVVKDLEIAIAEKRAEIRFEHLPQIDCIKNQMQQLFENIISNSLKYARKDVAPRIVISAIINAENVVMSFKDNGIGFDEKYLDKMFALFQRLHSRENYSGSGIGLAICKKIVDIHSGNITATSDQQSGANFIVTLPIHQKMIDHDH